MRTIKAKPITTEAFRPYGSFTDLLNPEGYNLGAFYQDRLLMHSSGNMQTAFSPLLIHKADHMIVSQSEYHNSTQESMLPLDDDMILFVAPASNVPVPEESEAFIVPKGTMVCLNTGVWHLAPYAVNKETGHVLIVLPERIYHNDCIVVDYTEEQKYEIVL
jgi:ureidoglycolate lyase